MIDGWVADFTAAAGSYDEDTARVGWIPNLRAAAMLEPLGLSPTRILDLGAGTGQTSSALRRLYPDADLTLVDPTAAMLRIAGAKLPAATLVESDAATFLGSATDAWDLVASIGCLELVPDLFEVLRLAAERLTSGGHLVASYEPLWGTGVQAVPVSRLDRGRTVTRHAADEVERRAASYGLVRVASRIDATFERDDDADDAVYELVVWRRAERATG